MADGFLILPCPDPGLSSTAHRTFRDLLFEPSCPAPLFPLRRLYPSASPQHAPVLLIHLTLQAIFSPTTLVQLLSSVPDKLQLITVAFPLVFHRPDQLLPSFPPSTSAASNHLNTLLSTLNFIALLRALFLLCRHLSLQLQVLPPPSNPSQILTLVNLTEVPGYNVE